MEYERKQVEVFIMFTMLFESNGQKQLKFYSISDLTQEFKMSRPMIENYLTECAALIGTQRFVINAYRGNGPDTKSKRPIIYVSEYIHDMIQHRITLKTAKNDFYHLLPDDKRELKKIIVRLYFKFDELIKGSNYPENRTDFDDAHHLYHLIRQGNHIDTMSEEQSAPVKMKFKCIHDENE